MLKRNGRGEEPQTVLKEKGRGAGIQERESLEASFVLSRKEASAEKEGSSSKSLE